MQYKERPFTERTVPSTSCVTYIKTSCRIERQANIVAFIPVHFNRVKYTKELHTSLAERHLSLPSPNQRLRDGNDDGAQRAALHWTSMAT